MPIAPWRPCPTPQCPRLTRRGPCVACRRAQDQQRGSAAARGYGRRWQQYRAWVLRQHPLCAPCQATGVMRAATVVDHITPHRGNQTLFWDTRNHMPLCRSCHNRKTATQDGGFGRGPARRGY